MWSRAIVTCSANMNKKIVIIGAGASGIACGTKLMSNGFQNIVILEAENRIGGRIHTIPFGKNVVDLGAQWCHGQVDNVVHELGSKCNVFASNTAKYDGSKFYQSDGTELSSEIGDQLMGLVIAIVEEFKDEMQRYQGSLGNFIVEKYREALRTDRFKNFDPNVCQQFLDFFHKYENSIEASDTWFDTSCRGYCEYWDCDGDRLLNWKDKGYRTVFDLLMKKIPNPADAIPIEEKILFNKAVTNIDWKHTKEPAVTITCIDGTVVDADHVIVTTSLGVLKEKHHQLFNPPLPPKKVSAIEGLVLGTVDKIYLEFEKPFWDKGWEGFSLLWKESDLVKVRQMEHNWLEHVFGFYVVDYQPNILCGWISGPNARRMELATDEDVRNGATMLLRMFLRKYNVPDPVAIKRTQWYSNPHFRGSYTFRSMKSDMLNVGPSDLAEPITNCQGKPIVHFAGEATHDHYYSTVHGAIESGWREAKRIVDLYKKKSQL